MELNRDILHLMNALAMTGSEVDVVAVVSFSLRFCGRFGLGFFGLVGDGRFGGLVLRCCCRRIGRLRRVGVAMERLLLVEGCWLRVVGWGLVVLVGCWGLAVVAFSASQPRLSLGGRWFAVDCGDERRQRNLA